MMMVTMGPVMMAALYERDPLHVNHRRGLDNARINLWKTSTILHVMSFTLRVHPNIISSIADISACARTSRCPLMTIGELKYLIRVTLILPLAMITTHLYTLDFVMHVPPDDV